MPGNNSMVKCIRINKATLSATIRVTVNELRIITDSVDYMADKHEVNLLNLSSEKEVRNWLTITQLRKIS